MKHLDYWINRCCDCPYYRVLDVAKIDGKCERHEKYVIDSSVTAEYCDLEDDHERQGETPK